MLALPHTHRHSITGHYFPQSYQEEGQNTLKGPRFSASEQAAEDAKISL